MRGRGSAARGRRARPRRQRDRRRDDPGAAASATARSTLENQLATLDEAVALAPDSFEARLLRGEVRQEARDFEGALADATAALALRPQDPRARALRMRALAHLARYAEAQVDADALLETSYGQSDLRVLHEAPEVALRNGQIARGIELLEWVLRDRDPAWIEGWSLLSWAYGQQGDEKNAERAQENVRITTRNRAMLYHRMARSALWLGNPTTQWCCSASRCRSTRSTRARAASSSICSRRTRS